MWNEIIEKGIILPVKWQKDHSGRGFFHKEMGTIGQAILSKWQNVITNDWHENNVTSQVPKIKLWKRLFSQRNGDNRPSNSSKWQNVNLI